MRVLRLGSALRRAASGSCLVVAASALTVGFAIAGFAQSDSPEPSSPPVVVEGAEHPYLGTAPLPPPDVSGLPRAPRVKSATTGFTVNSASREGVRSFYNAVFTASDGVPIGSTADVTNCIPGTNAPSFYEATLRRINWFRAMAGVPATVTFDPTFCEKNQQAAEMMSANYALNHFPPPSWTCWTQDGSDAAGNSDLDMGNNGPTSMMDYMVDYGLNNAAVGHRRWLLYPQTQLMGTGDVPAQTPRYSANATWVIDGNFGGLRPPTRQPFVSWPPAGYVPYQLVFPRWSFSFPGADFANAAVTLTSNGVPVVATLEPLAFGEGENTLVWVAMGLQTSNYPSSWPFSGTDTVYSVSVNSVVIGGVSSNFSYDVTVFDPRVAGPDYFPPIVSGPSLPAARQNNLYSFSPAVNATGYQWRNAQRVPFNWSDGAEAGLANFTTNTSDGYSVIQSSVRAAGTYAFHLAHVQPADQILTLTHLLCPSNNAVLTFQSRLGYATTAETAKVQASVDSGVSWGDIFNRTGAGTNSSGQSSFSNCTVSLASFAGRSIQLRFIYQVQPSSQYYTTGTGVGWYIDTISVSGSDELLSPVIAAATTTNFTFNPPQSGNYNLDVRPLISGDFPGEWGPSKAVSAVSNAAPVIIVVDRYALSAGKLAIDFTLQSGAAATFKLLSAAQVSGPWSTNSSAVLSTNIPGSSYRFTATPGTSPQFYRVKTP